MTFVMPVCMLNLYKLAFERVLVRWLYLLPFGDRLGQVKVKARLKLRRSLEAPRVDASILAVASVSRLLTPSSFVSA